MVFANVKQDIKKIIHMENVYQIVDQIKWELMDSVNVQRAINKLVEAIVFWTALQEVQILMVCAYVNKIVGEKVILIVLMGKIINH